MTLKPTYDELLRENEQRRAENAELKRRLAAAERRAQAFMGGHRNQFVSMQVYE